jgi:uncharacterized protein (UPF0303 family)
MGRFVSDPKWLDVLREQEEKLRFDTFTRDDALSIGTRILELAKERYDGSICVSITEHDDVVFYCKMPGTTLENDAWVFRKRNTSKATGVSSLRVYMEIESGLREDVWQQRQDVYVACGGCMPVLMREGETFAYFVVSGLEHNLDHQVIADAVAEHLNTKVGSVA